MKKIIAIALSLILVLSLSVTAFAASEFDGNIDANEGTNVGTATGEYIAGTGAPDTYSVDIAWTGLAFTYTASDKIWDATNHEEIDNPDDDPVWSTGAKIVVTNHSNVAIIASAEFRQTAAEGNNATITPGADLNLAKADGAETTGAITLTASGSLAADFDGEIGKITVTINKYVPAT